MLTLTQNATQAVQGLATQAQLPDSGGLRIAPAPDRASVELSLVPEAPEGDEVVEDNGARVYLEPSVVPLLADQQLDAVSSGADGVGFVLAPQG